MLVIGGSLGARTINESVLQGIDKLTGAGLQVIWQTGKGFFSGVRDLVESMAGRGVCIREFIQRMDLAYASADLVVSRAGASSVSELSIVGKPSILMPSPNVAEDHQTKNAMALVGKKAALLVNDQEAAGKLIPEVIRLDRKSTR